MKRLEAFFVLYEDGLEVYGGFLVEVYLGCSGRMHLLDFGVILAGLGGVQGRGWKHKLKIIEVIYGYNDKIMMWKLERIWQARNESYLDYIHYLIIEEKILESLGSFS